MIKAKFQTCLRYIVFATFCAGILLALVHAFTQAYFFSSYPYDGPFQTLYSLRKLANGQFPGIDYFFFHGNGIPYIHYPIYYIFGKTLFGSQFSEAFVHIVVLLVPLYLVFKKFYGHFQAQIVCVLWAALSMLSFTGSPAITALSLFQSLSSFGLRTVSIFVFIFLLLRLNDSKDEKSFLKMTGLLLVFSPIAFMMGAEHGLYGALLSYVYVVALRFKQFRFKSIAAYVAGYPIALGAVFVGMHLLLFGRLKALSEFKNLMGDQTWYFGVYPHIFFRSIDDFFTLGGTQMVPYRYLMGLIVITLILAVTFFKKVSSRAKTAKIILISFLFLEGLFGLASNSGYISIHYAAPLIRGIIITWLVMYFDIVVKAEENDQKKVSRFFLMSAQAGVFIFAIGVMVAFYNTSQKITPVGKDGTYQENVFSGVKLSLTDTQEAVPPFLRFNHGHVLSEVVREVSGESNEGRESIWKRIKDKFNLDASSAESKVFPYLGFLNGKFFFNGISTQTKIDGTFKDDLQPGSKVVLQYDDNTFSDLLLVQSVNDKDFVLGGPAQPDKVVVRFSTIDIDRSPKNKKIIIRKDSYLPYVFDGIVSLEKGRFGLLLDYRKNIFNGEQLSLNGTKVTISNSIYMNSQYMMAIVESAEPLVSFTDTFAGYVVREENFKATSLKPNKTFEVKNGEVHYDIEMLLPSVPTGISRISHQRGEFQVERLNEKIVKYLSGNFIHPEEYYKASSSAHFIPLVLNTPATVVRAEKIQHKETAPIWSTYTGLINLNYGTFNPSGSDYLIHVLGQENRIKYNENFVAMKPTYVQISSRNFDNTDFHGWSLVTSWNFYHEILKNYDPVVTEDYLQLWKYNAKAVQTPDAPAQSVQLPYALTIESKDKCNLALYQVQISYTIKNHLKGLPFFGGLFRFVLFANGNNLNIPISLPIYSGTVSVPIIGYAGDRLEISTQLFGLIPHSVDFHVDQVLISEIQAPSEKISTMFLPNLVQEGKVCGRYLTYEGHGK